MRKLGLSPHNSQKRNPYLGLSLQCSGAFLPSSVRQDTQQMKTWSIVCSQWFIPRNNKHKKVKQVPPNNNTNRETVTIVTNRHWQPLLKQSQSDDKQQPSEKSCMPVSFSQKRPITTAAEHDHQTWTPLLTSARTTHHCKNKSWTPVVRHICILMRQNWLVVPSQPPYQPRKRHKQWILFPHLPSVFTYFPTYPFLSPLRLPFFSTGELLNHPTFS